MSEHLKIVFYGLYCMYIMSIDKIRLEIRRKFLTNVFYEVLE